MVALPDRVPRTGAAGASRPRPSEDNALEHRHVRLPTGPATANTIVIDYQSSLLGQGKAKKKVAGSTFNYWSRLRTTEDTPTLALWDFIQEKWIDVPHISLTYPNGTPGNPSGGEWGSTTNPGASNTQSVWVTGAVTPVMASSFLATTDLGNARTLRVKVNYDSDSQCAAVNCQITIPDELKIIGTLRTTFESSSVACSCAFVHRCRNRRGLAPRRADD